ncbi:uncharacterized protein Tsen15 [Drosophila bipectinata]|uniref:uncharacterized protein Tsen15 n=1 Tax=Drosophila bipectinata TaxID=42026 RepID=UPI001C8A2085|nr:uncharacterized protein LOC108132949 [Drosophila bipectinata]
MLKLSDFQTVCPDSLSATIGYQIYTDLKNDPQNVDLEPSYDKSLKLFCLKQENRVYIPVLHTKLINFRQLQQFKEKCGSNANIFLAIIDNTANILYYELNQGFCEKPK